LKFELQHVMIVGASDGLGKELVREVFMKGALVTMIGRDEKKMKEIRDELDFATQGDPLIRYFKADITILESYEVEKLIRQAEKYLGSVEMIIFCAAKSEPVMFISSDLNKFKSHMDLNFFCVVKFLIPVAKRMVLRKT
jgi:short-subunit dehydrogenase